MKIGLRTARPLGWAIAQHIREHGGDIVDHRHIARGWWGTAGRDVDFRGGEPDYYLSVLWPDIIRPDALAQHPWKQWADASVTADGTEQRMPGGQSRWSQGKDLSWEPLRVELVVEVAYDHMQGERFRHTAQFRRFRSDKPARECTYGQLEVVPPQELTALFAV
jgi:hypothetical protein